MRKASPLDTAMEMSGLVWAPVVCVCGGVCVCLCVHGCIYASVCVLGVGGFAWVDMCKCVHLCVVVSLCVCVPYGSSQ